jgi:hypothetical protein
MNTTQTIGSKVLCLDKEPLKGNSIAPPLEVDKEYPIVEIFHCKCGQSHFDVGLSVAEDVNFVTCYNCKEKLPFTEKDSLPSDMTRRVHWCHPSRFVSECVN